MGKPSVYVETTVISYLASRPSSDAIVASHQITTRRWWDLKASEFDLFSSVLVVREASKGDVQAAAARQEFLKGIQILEAASDAEELTRQLLSRGAVPATVPEDAAHIAIAATAGIEFLTTWNCRHLANAHLWRRIDETVRGFGCEPPIICTPDMLLGEDADVD